MGHKANSISIEEIKKIEIGEHDILAIGLPKTYGPIEVENVRRMLEKFMPDKLDKVLLYVGGIKFNSISFVDGKPVTNNANLKDQNKINTD